MASLYRERGSYIVAFFDEARHRRRINTGLGDKGAAREVQRKVEDLIGCRAAGKHPSDDLRRWTDGMTDALRQRFVNAGLLDDRHRRPHELVEAFRQHLADKANTPGHVDKTVRRLQAVLDGCKVTKLADLNAMGVLRFLAELRASKPSGQRAVGKATSNYYLRAAKQFTRWLVRERMIAFDPLAGLSAINARAERRQRQALRADQFQAMLTAAHSGPERFGVSGADRAALYQVAVETGLRASELRSLTRASFDLASDDPSVTVEAAHAKNRRRDTLPLRQETAAMLRDYLANKLPTAPALCLPDKYAMADMIRADAREAGVAVVDDADRRLDFHSLRHTTGTWLAAAGVHPKVIQRIMRHSTITLTMDRYAHAFKNDEAAALEKLPQVSVAVDARRATGTDDAPMPVVGASEPREQNYERAARFQRHHAAPSGAGHRRRDNRATDGRRLNNVAKPVQFAAIADVAQSAERGIHKP